MDDLKASLTSVDLENLLKLFDIQIALGVFVFFIIFKPIFAKIIIKIYYKIIKSKKNPKESSMYRPLNLAFFLLGTYLMIYILRPSKQFLSITNQIFSVIVTYFIFKAISALVTENSTILKRVLLRPDNAPINKFMCKIIRAVLWIIFLIIAFVEIGFDLSKFSGLAAGLGIGSAALALAAQDMIKSMLSGAAILTDKPFTIGDWIEVGEYEGSVIDITFRSTRIKALNNTVITIPNSTITSTSVINWSRLTSRRFECVLNLSLDTTSEKVRKVGKEIKLVLQNNPEVIKETVEVNLDAISHSSSDIKIFCYVKQAEFRKYIKAKQDILCSILFLVEKENIDLAYPTQTVYVKNEKEEETE